MLTKILAIYSAFYVGMKLIAIFFREALVVPNLLLCLPFLALAIWGWLALKRKNTTWLYVIVAIIIVSAIRYFETDLLLWLAQTL